MDISIIASTVLTALAGLAGLIVGEIRATHRWRDDRESRRWLEIMECLRIVENPMEAPRLKEVAARRLRQLEIPQDMSVKNASPNPHLEPSVLVPGGGTLDPRSPGRRSIGYEFWHRPSWERIKRTGIRSRITEAAVIAALATAFAALVQTLV